MKSNPISPEKLAEARVAAAAHNRQLGSEVFTPEEFAETMRRIDERLVAKAHREAMKAIRFAEAVQPRQVVRYDATSIKRRSLIIVSRAPRLLRRQVKASNSDDDDHDSNLLMNPPRDPAYSRGPFFFNTNDYAW